MSYLGKYPELGNDIMLRSSDWDIYDQQAFQKTLAYLMFVIKGILHIE